MLEKAMQSVAAGVAEAGEDGIDSRVLELLLESTTQGPTQRGGGEGEGRGAGVPEDEEAVAAVVSAAVDAATAAGASDYLSQEDMVELGEL